MIYKYIVVNSDDDEFYLDNNLEIINVIRVTYAGGIRCFELLVKEKD